MVRLGQHNVVRLPTAEEAQRVLGQGERAIPTQWILGSANEKLRHGPDGHNAPPKYTHRFVVRDGLEHGGCRCDSPTVGVETHNTIMGTTASGKPRLRNADVANVYFTGGNLTRTSLPNMPKRVDYPIKEPTSTSTRSHLSRLTVP